MATGLDLEDTMNSMLGYCSVNQKFNPGLLAESTKPIIQDLLIKFLQEKGFNEEAAKKILLDVWEDGELGDETLKALADLKLLFKILNENGVRIAVSTSDSRAGTEEALKSLDIYQYVDHLICGDDPGIEPKPHPFSAMKICEQLDVSPADTVMVGDTKADVGMGKAANIGWNVGVLSGVGNCVDLLPEADHVIHSVKDLLPLILPGETWKRYYKYSTTERILMEPHTAEEEGDQMSNTMVTLKNDVNLVIFDLYGTLLCVQKRYMDWLCHICERYQKVFVLNS